MKLRTLVWILLPMIAGCWLFDAGQSATLEVRSVVLRGTLPAVTGVATVTIAGQPAVIAAGTWSGTVQLTGAATQVDVVFAIDGTEVARRTVSVDRNTP